MTARPPTIPALVPRPGGHQFVFYGDACSGVRGGHHEKTFARTNDVVRRLRPQPEFLVFAGDEVVGLTPDEAELRRQWQYWLDVEMGWLDRSAIPLYNTTSNHTTYDRMSERVFAEVLELPRNGPTGQEGLAYHVRRDDLLVVFVHTGATTLGGEGHVESRWLDSVLTANRDARHKLVVGHHPVFSVNGFSGERQRELDHGEGRRLWNVLVRHDVTAYLCSHILAFDVQVHDGVLQVVSAGAGTAHRMPEETEYLHCVQVAIDDDGFRYQVIDQSGSVRERLTWPIDQHQDGEQAGDLVARPTAWRVDGLTSTDGDGSPQTLIVNEPGDRGLPSPWIGLTGPNQRLTVTMSREPGRSPHYWFGPELASGQRFEIDIALHPGMGPGGVLHRVGDRWSSCTSSSPWGPEAVIHHGPWRLGSAPDVPGEAFRGSDLRARRIDGNPRRVTS